ncbi:hypothetical protein MHYP_G00014400 [Metynnis hypsauchen]
MENVWQEENRMFAKKDHVSINVSSNKKRWTYIKNYLQNLKKRNHGSCDSNVITYCSLHDFIRFCWVRYQGHCFFYISQALDWASAEAHCLTLGAHLVSVHSESEYKMVKAFIRTHDNKENPTWLGLSNCQKRGSWFWSDGSKFGYSKWNRNEPNALNGECCVHLNWTDQKDWNDIPCNLAYPSVCRKKVARN